MRSFDFPPATRPVAMGANGMVSSAHPLASLAGIARYYSAAAMRSTQWWRLLRPST